MGSGDDVNAVPHCLCRSHQWWHCHELHLSYTRHKPSFLVCLFVSKLAVSSCTVALSVRLSVPQAVHQLYSCVCRADKVTLCTSFFLMSLSLPLSPQAQVQASKGACTSAHHSLGVVGHRDATVLLPRKACWMVVLYILDHGFPDRRESIFECDVALRATTHTKFESTVGGHRSVV